MKSLLTLAAFLTSFGAQAAPREAFQAVLASEAYSEATASYGSDLVELRESAVYRCPGCFGFEARLGRGEQERLVEFGTRGRPGNGGLVYQVSGGKLKQPAGGRCIAMGRVGGESEACAKHQSAEACESRAHWEFCRWER